ncbi:MAG: response regulator [SAR324 cluster bacterium]|nr:response regulator [SAR324 cluster bacterium]
MTLILDKTKLKLKPEANSPDKPLILLVDDELSLLDSTSELLALDYRVLKAASGAKALELLENTTEPIPLIITDQRMPEMTGVEFLKASLELMPDALRIVVTGYSDLDAIIDFVNDVQIYKFITKPFDPANFKLTIQRAMEASALKKQNANLVAKLQEANLQLTDKIEQQDEEKKRRMHVDCMKVALIVWELTHQKTKAELASESGLWSSNFDEKGTLRSKTIERYLNLESLPQTPKTALVVQTAQFVLDHCPKKDQFRDLLESHIADLCGLLLQRLS